MSSWQLVSDIAYRGSTAVVSGSARAGVWLAAPAGLFRLQNGRWQLQQRQIPFWHLNCVAVSDNVVLAGGLPHGIVRSATRGETWRMAWTEQTRSPITCLAPSPRTDQDGVWLAGTQGDGILRSTDHGRHWELANWGLQDFTVLSIVAAPHWGEREFVFAITVEGIYQSPNGGRAWRFVGEPFTQDPAQACAVSPHFDKNATVWLVTASGYFYESTDYGRTWTAIKINHLGWLTNDLIALPDGTLLIAGSGIWRSDDNGRSWYPAQHPLLSSEQQIFKLSRVDTRLYASLINGGAWYSDDAGATWTAVTGLSSGRFLWLEVLDNTLLAGGPLVGLWRAAEEKPAKVVDDDEAILALTCNNDRLLISKPSGLIVGDQIVQQPESPLVQVAWGGGRTWGIDEHGALWQHDAKGWHTVTLPAAAVALAANDNAVVIAMADRRQKELAVAMQQYDAPDKWHKLTAMPAVAQRIRLAIAADSTVTLMAGRSVRTVRWPTLACESVTLADSAAPLVALVQSDDFGGTVVASIEKAWLTKNGKAWQSLSDPAKGEVIADMALKKHDSGWDVYALTGDGRIWCLEIE